jgi:hypothetical protein
MEKAKYIFYREDAKNAKNSNQELKEHFFLVCFAFFAPSR